MFTQGECLDMAGAYLKLAEEMRGGMAERNAGGSKRSSSQLAVHIFHLVSLTSTVMNNDK